MRSFRRHITHSAGLMQEVPGVSVPKNFTPDAWNVELSGEGKVRFPRGGVERFTTASLNGEIKGFWQLVRRNGSWALVAECGGSFYNVTATGATSLIKSGLRDLGPWSGVSYLGKLFLANGYNPIQVFDTEMEALEDMEFVSLPSSWKVGNRPKVVGLINEGTDERLFAFGLKDDPSRVYFSGLKDYLDWTSLSNAFSLAPFEDDGEKTMAVSSYLDMLFIHKETRTAIYKGLDPTQGTVESFRDIPFGCVSQGSIVPYHNGLAWISQHGPITLRAVQAYSDVAGDVMVSRIKKAWQAVDPTRLHQAVGHYDPRHERIRWFCPDRQNVKNNLIFDYYPERLSKDSNGNVIGAWIVGKGIEASQVITYGTVAQAQTLVSDYDGWINRIAGRQDLGVDIDSYYSYPTMGGRQIQLSEFDFFVNEGGGSLRLEMSWNDRDPEAISGDLSPDFAADDPPAMCRKIPYGIGYRVRPLVRHTGGSTVAEIDSVTISGSEAEK